MKYLSRILLVVLAILCGISCSRKTYEMLYPTLFDGKYDTEFPYRDCSEQLENISHSIFKIYCLADYKTYLLDPGQKLLPNDLSIDKLFNSTMNTVKNSDAASGTAVLICYDDTHVALITCAHLVSHPDTIYSYHNDNDPYTTDYLAGVSVKTQEHIFFRGYPEGNNLEVLAIDTELDLAIIGKSTTGNRSDLRPFPYPLGYSEELKWGSFAYVMGFPRGYQMVTRGIVSRPDYLGENSFLIDAVFNEGFSGSIVLAIKDGIPNFELVGIGKSALVTYDNVLVPSEQEQNGIYNPNVPYDGEIYVSRKTVMNYGVTFAVSTSAIRDFYRANQKYLADRGYSFGDFFE